MRLELLNDDNKVYCPKCVEEIWDIAKNNKLHRCWSCHTAYCNESVLHIMDGDLYWLSDDGLTPVSEAEVLQGEGSEQGV